VTKKSQRKKQRTVADDIPVGYIRLPLTGAVVPVGYFSRSKNRRPAQVVSPKPKTLFHGSSCKKEKVARRRLFASPEEAKKWLRQFNRAYAHLETVRGFKKKKAWKGPRPIFYEGGAPGLVQQK
jgi:hypothetical protein